MHAPVLPLAHHTYLYYLYLPWAGLCWAFAGAAERLARRWPVLRTSLLVLLVLQKVFLSAEEIRESIEEFIDDEN